MFKMSVVPPLLLTTLLLAQSLTVSPLNTLEGEVVGWKSGDHEIGIVSEDVLALGRVDAKGAFSLKLSNNRKLLKEYLMDIDTFLAKEYKDHKKFDVKVSNPLVQVRTFNRFHTRRVGTTEWEDSLIMSDGEIKSVPEKTRIQAALIYADGQVDIEGETVEDISKTNTLTIKFDLHLPEGWSLIEEKSIYAKNGNKTIVYKSINKPSLPWQHISW